jgi:hypothetical protein
MQSRINFNDIKIIGFKEKQNTNADPLHVAKDPNNNSDITVLLLLRDNWLSKFIKILVRLVNGRAHSIGGSIQPPILNMSFACDNNYIQKKISKKKFLHIQ